jgi:soluble lytic murein transglycosylase
MLSHATEDRALQEFSSASSRKTITPRALTACSGATNARSPASRAAASVFLAHLTADRAVAQARIASKPVARRGLQAAIDAVPASRQDDPGLLYDRAQYRRRTDNRSRPCRWRRASIRAKRRSPPAPTSSAERRLYVPRAMRAGNYSQAYQLVSNHGLTSGESFADAEWLSGWLSLRYLNQPQRAAEHFSHLSENVSSPVSFSRALLAR